MPATILILDDEDTFREDLAALLRKKGYVCHTSDHATAGIALAQDLRPDLVLCDVVMPGGGAVAVLRALEDTPEIGVIVMTAFGSLETAVEAFRAGAVDYLLKPLKVDEVHRKIVRFSEVQEARRKLQAARRHLSEEEAGVALVGEAPAMAAVRRLIAQVASIRTTVLVSGETGTGKDVVARALHRASPFRNEPYLAVNCAAFPETLLESELFGHVRGAFTGAVRDKVGLMEAAGGGTLFLDEVSETTLPVQAKLLRAVEQREATPVGATRPRRIEARIVASSNRNLDESVAAGTFRRDLLFRLRIIEIRLPPLRERKEDIPRLVEHFMAMCCRDLKRDVSGVEGDAMRAMLGYSWPGNVRELRNVVERAVILNQSGTLGLEDLPHALTGGIGPSAAPDDLRTALRLYEKEHLRRVLVETGGDKEAAARRLGIDLSTLYRKLGHHAQPGATAHRSFDEG